MVCTCGINAIPVLPVRMGGCGDGVNEVWVGAANGHREPESNSFPPMVLSKGRSLHPAAVAKWVSDGVPFRSCTL